MLARLILFAIPLLTAISPAFAASPKDVAEVASMVNDKAVSVLHRRHDPVNDVDAMTFVHQHKRYTFHVGEGLLAVWVRKDGTHSREALDTFSDYGLDGIVDSGTHGRDDDKHFSSDDDVLVGPNQRPYWQERYDQAIEAALRYKRRKKK